MTLMRLRNRTLLSLAPLMVLLMPMALVADCSGGGIQLTGNTQVVATCTSWAGVTWSASTIGFLPNVGIIYEVEVYYNGVRVWTSQSGQYHTDGAGNHFQWPANAGNNTIECGSGFYSVQVYTRTLDAMTHTFSGSDEVYCP